MLKKNKVPMSEVGDERGVTANADKYAVFGQPIKHSKSPVIHAAFAAQFEEAVSYRAIGVELDAFEHKVSAFFDAGGAGLNITAPFKARAFALAEEVSDRALRAKAANVLLPLPTGGLRADNTDGVGLVRDMVTNCGWQLHGRRTLILGAGGAVRGILQPLLHERPASVFIANRTAVKAEQLAMEFDDVGVSIQGGGYDALAGQSFDLVINATSAGLAREMPELPSFTLTERCCCYDMVYGSEPTLFMRWAAGQAAWATSDGLGMLVEQAAESYYLWRGKRPATRPIIQQLRQPLAD